MEKPENFTGMIKGFYEMISGGKQNLWDNARFIRTNMNIRFR